MTQFPLTTSAKPSSVPEDSTRLGLHLLSYLAYPQLFLCSRLRISCQEKRHPFRSSIALFISPPSPGRLGAACLSAPLGAVFRVFQFFYWNLGGSGVQLTSAHPCCSGMTAVRR